VRKTGVELRVEPADRWFLSEKRHSRPALLLVVQGRHLRATRRQLRALREWELCSDLARIRTRPETVCSLAPGSRIAIKALDA
jgi:hypothetical protein